jgi:hypothetical protein
MRNLNDIVLQIHMTFLNHRDSVAWISSFKDEISPLSEAEFQRLIDMLEGVDQAEQANFAESLSMNNIPSHLQLKAAGQATLYVLIEKLKEEYSSWRV